MPSITADEARSLARAFSDLSHSVHVYLIDHWKALNPTQRKKLDAHQWSLLNLSSDLTAQAVSLTLQDVDSTLDGIKQATEKATETLRSIKKVETAVTIASAAASLAAAVASGHPDAIASSLSNLADLL